MAVASIRSRIAVGVMVVVILELTIFSGKTWHTDANKVSSIVNCSRRDASSTRQARIVQARVRQMTVLVCGRIAALTCQHVAQLACRVRANPVVVVIGIIVCALGAAVLKIKTIS